MSFKTTILLSLSALLALSFSGCAGSGVRITEGKNEGISERSTASAAGTATLVHINDQDRLVTIRNGRELPAGFLIAKNRYGDQTAILKARPPRAIGLRTADILEGSPAINNSITPADAATSAKLEQRYPSAVGE